MPLSSLSLSGPRFVPLELAVSYPSPAAEGRGWKYCGAANFWPSSAEPTASSGCVVNAPSLVSSEPFAWVGKTIWAIPQTPSCSPWHPVPPSYPCLSSSAVCPSLLVAPPALASVGGEARRTERPTRQRADLSGCTGGGA